jgi:putative membrane protein
MRYKALIVGVALAVASVASVRAQAGDQAFVTKLAGVAMAEVELGKLAKEKASSREVRAFGQRMIDDHTKAGDELKGIAQRKNLAWPAALPPDAIALKDKLSKLNGAAFDRAYIDEMVKGHTEVLGEVKKGAQSASDPDVKAWATKATSSVQAHLTHAQDQQKELGKAATH